MNSPLPEFMSTFVGMNGLDGFLAEAGFTGDALPVVVGAFRQRSLAKGELFAQEGRICDQLGYVERGLFQFFCDRNGDELTTYTAGPQSFIVSLSSFLKRQPARETIRALTDSVIWAIQKTDFDRLREALPAFDVFYVHLLEEQINCIEESRHSLLTLTAEQRYQKLMAEEPQLLQEVPLHYLASILGVTPRHLSRIRGQIR